ncbi:hypothetical protein BDW62DRAFT_215760 [Aspergillus aurantiobrunneus]
MCDSALITAAALGYLSYTARTAAASLNNDALPPPDPEPIKVIELPLPPVTPTDDEGSCTATLNPHRTGCIGISSNLRGGSFLPDGNHVLATVNFTGAPAPPDPRSIYTGMQMILPSIPSLSKMVGALWRGITSSTAVMRRLQATSAPLRKSTSTPIRWEGGSIRELRIHPDNLHLGFNAFAQQNEVLGQYAYIGRLLFNPSPTTPHYKLVNVTRLFNPDAPQQHITNPQQKRNQHRRTARLHRKRKRNLSTGETRRLTQHPEYADPIDVSPDDNWAVILDTRGTDRQMWLAGMRGIPPITDLITSSLTSATRNNGDCRFFRPWLIDGQGDRGSYFGQRINAEGDGSAGAINDPNWNARADPAVVARRDADYVLPDSCPGPGLWRGESPAFLWFLSLRLSLGVFRLALMILFLFGGYLHQGYTMKGKVSGIVDVQIIGDEGSIGTIAVHYTDFSNDGVNTLVGTENVTASQMSYSATRADWYSDLVSTEETQSTRRTSSDGFHLEIDALVNIFNANGTMTTTVDGVLYEQPGNGM